MLLIVDFEPAALNAVCRLVESVGCEVVGTPTNGRDAVNLHLALSPDAVLLGLKVPGASGIQTVEKMMATRPVPVVVCSACHDYAVVSAAARAGAHAYVVEPFGLSDIVPAITVATSRFDDLCRLAARVNSLRKAAAARKWVERAKCVLMVSERMSEAEAHRYLQQESQRRRVPLANLARTVALSCQSFASVERDGSRLAA